MCKFGNYYIVIVKSAEGKGRSDVSMLTLECHFDCQLLGYKLCIDTPQI